MKPRPPHRQHHHLGEAAQLSPSSGTRRIYAFNPTSDISEAPAEVTAAYEWLKKHSVRITDLDAAPLLRKVTDAIAINLDGAAAATSTVMRKRAVLHGCLQYAVERGHFTVNPLHALPRRRLPRAAGVDRRVVVNPDQARSLLSTVRRLDPELEGFFACIYYAGLRPAEARNLRLMDCSLPEDGWGALLLSTSFQSVGPAWTDGGQPARNASSSIATAAIRGPFQPPPNWWKLCAGTSPRSRKASTVGCSSAVAVEPASRCPRPTPSPSP